MWTLWSGFVWGKRAAWWFSFVCSVRTSEWGQLFFSLYVPSLVILILILDKYLWTYITYINIYTQINDMQTFFKSCSYMHKNQCIINHWTLQCFCMLLFSYFFLSFSMIISFHRVSKYVLPFGSTGLNEKGKKKKDQTQITLPNGTCKQRCTQIHTYCTYPVILMPVFSSSWFEL